MVLNLFWWQFGIAELCGVPSSSNLPLTAIFHVIHVGSVFEENNDGTQSIELVKA